ncbi:alpha/beta hydrolase [Croceibacterium xixiisoli]|uniref:alpha/beta hydrolase n=1 Tax=Croceibacterium xixiisoli TaxID=1476466 RepID=UPI002E25956F
MKDSDVASAVAPIDPQIAEFARRLAAAYATCGQPASLAERRQMAESVRQPWRSGGPVMAHTQDLTINGLRARLHRPQPATDQPSPVMLYLHGGGWVLFSIDTHDRLMREYAARAGIAVLGIDYSLAPEAKFPVAVNEVVGALAWLEAGAAGLGLDPTQLFIGGDSAGANLAVSACLTRRDNGQARLAGMLLNYGAFDPAPTASYTLYAGDDHTLNVEEMDAFWSAYTDSPAQLTDPLVAPLLAQLHDLPPAFLAIAERDILADSNHAFAARLRQAGGEVEAVSYAGATHSFLEAVSIAPLAARALDDQAAWIRQHCTAPAHG